MMTASPGATYENDILGTRTWKNKNASGAWRMIWDEAGRMLKAAGPTNGATYMYRADGMRIRKVTGLQLLWIEDEETASGYYDEEYDANNPTYRYRYDGQMCFEEDYTVNVPGSPPTASVTGNSYALGARGIDMMRTFTVNVSNYERTYDTNGKSFPIYDGHGNMIATLGRSASSPYYSIGNERQYDVWGGVRSGSSSGDPNNRYCANLGHKQDDESGLIYMRARYYEPGTGRFVSRDPDHAGSNWYAYCNSDPINLVDTSGRNPVLVALVWTGLQLLCGTILQWLPGEYGRIVRTLVSETANLLAAVTLVTAALAADPKNASIVATGAIAGGIGLVCLLVLGYQVGLLLLIALDDMSNAASSLTGYGFLGDLLSDGTRGFLNKLAGFSWKDGFGG